jgi:hypothetical protein
VFSATTCTSAAGPSTGSTGATGPQGPEGGVGLQGPQGPSGIQVMMLYDVQYNTTTHTFEKKYRHVKISEDLLTTGWISVFTTATCS